MDTSTLWLIIVGGTALGLFTIYRRQQADAQAKQASEYRKDEVRRIAVKAQAAYDKATDAKTATGQVNGAKRAIAILSEAEAYPEYREVIRNYDEMHDHLEAITRVAPVIDKVEKAYRHKFKGNDKSELNALLDAMYEIRTQDVTDRDIFIARLFPSGTGEIVSVSGIQARCKQLGWDG